MVTAKNTKPIILVVDDTPENIDVLKGVLNADYAIRPARNGQIALKAANVFPLPDLVLLDIMMPDMDGYEVCRRLKADAVTRDIPIIFVTAKSEIEDEIEGLQLGAVDYITKPFRIPVVLARVQTHLALRTATRKLDTYNQLLLQERELIESIILKMRSADALDERHLRYLMTPVELTAGDILCATFTPDGRQLVLLGDSTGHGLQAAIGGSLSTYIFYDLASRGFSGEKILESINRQLCLRLPVGIFLAATMLEIDSTRCRVLHWNAGMPDTLLFHDGVCKSHLSAGLFPLGIAKNIDILGGATEFVLEKGDRIYICSDGIVEAKNAEDAMFGMDSLVAFLGKVAEGGHALLDLSAILNDHVVSAVHEDDITIVEIQI